MTPKPCKVQGLRAGGSGFGMLACPAFSRPWVQFNRNSEQDGAIILNSSDGLQEDRQSWVV